MSDTVFGLLSAKRSLIGVLLGSAKSIARFRLRQRHAQILGEGLNCSEIHSSLQNVAGTKLDPVTASTEGKSLPEVRACISAARDELAKLRRIPVPSPDLRGRVERRIGFAIRMNLAS